MWVPSMSFRLLMPNISSEAVTRVYSVVVASTIKLDIPGNSVGNRHHAHAVPPAHQGFVASPLRGIDRTGGFASTKPQCRTVPRQGMLGSRGPDSWIGPATAQKDPQPSLVDLQAEFWAR